jgi:cytochrome c
MKKTMVVLSAIVLFIACGGSDEKKDETKKDESTTTAKEEDPEIKRGFDMIAKSDCFTCHKTSEKSTGPAYTVVAAAYENNQESIDYLAGKIITGGSGKFGEIPMTPHPTLALDSAKIMAKYVLSLKENK